MCETGKPGQPGNYTGKSQELVEILPSSFRRREDVDEEQESAGSNGSYHSPSLSTEVEISRNDGNKDNYSKP